MDVSQNIYKGNTEHIDTQQKLTQLPFSQMQQQLMRHTNVLDKYVRKTQNDAQERNTDKYVYAFDMALERDPTELDAGETGRQRFERDIQQLIFLLRTEKDIVKKQRLQQQYAEKLNEQQLLQDDDQKKMKDLWLKKKAESEFLAGEFEAFSQLIRFHLPEISNDAQVSQSSTEHSVTIMTNQLNQISQLETLKKEALMACCKHSDGYKDIGMQDSGFKINNSMIHVKKEQIDRRCWMLNDNLVELPQVQATISVE